MNPLIVTYTNEVKDYCDEEFFNNLLKLSTPQPKIYDVLVVDNTPSFRYSAKLSCMFKTWGNFKLAHLMVTREPKTSLFQRNVADSANMCRQEFLNGNYDSMLVIESDVIPPVDLIERLEADLEIVDPNWGAIGALYYKGFHDYEKDGIHPTHHVLSGCTLYSRPLLEKYPFRYDEKSLAQFPDFWICYDTKKEFELYNDHDIHCDHLHTATGMRQSKPL
jgi:hypothetical protein